MLVTDPCGLQNFLFVSLRYEQKWDDPAVGHSGWDGQRSPGALLLLPAWRMLGRRWQLRSQHNGIELSMDPRRNAATEKGNLGGGGMQGNSSSPANPSLPIAALSHRALTFPREASAPAAGWEDALSWISHLSSPFFFFFFFFPTGEGREGEAKRQLGVHGFLEEKPRVEHPSLCRYLESHEPSRDEAPAVGGSAGE